MRHTFYSQRRQRQHLRGRRGGGAADRQGRARPRQRLHDRRAVRDVRPDARNDRLPAGAHRHRDPDRSGARGQNEAFVRTALGYTFAQDRGFGRAWSPMMEVLVAKPADGSAEWDVVPQMQVSLSKLQHVLISVGARIPLERARGAKAAVPHLLPVGLVRRRAVPVLEMSTMRRITWTDPPICRSPRWCGSIAMLAAVPRAADQAAGRGTGEPASRSLAVHAFRQLRRVPQQPHGAKRRGRVDRRDVALDDDGPLVAGPVLAGIGASRGDRPSIARGRIEDECAACHMPMTQRIASAAGAKGEVFAHLPIDRDQSDCSASPETESRARSAIRSRRTDWARATNFNANFVMKPTPPDGTRAILRQLRRRSGPADDHALGHRLLQPEAAPHIKQSEVCATCHTLITQAFGPDGRSLASCTSR